MAVTTGRVVLATAHQVRVAAIFRRTRHALGGVAVTLASVGRIRKHITEMKNLLLNKQPSQTASLGELKNAFGNEKNHSHLEIKKAVISYLPPTAKSEMA